MITVLLSLGTDYDEYYRELLKRGIKYGMTFDEFWNLEWKNFEIYQEVYFEKLHEEKHIQGLYNYIGLQVVLGQAFYDKKKSKGKPLPEYPKINLYAENSSLSQSNTNYKNKTKKTKNNKIFNNIKDEKQLEVEYRNYLANFKEMDYN